MALSARVGALVLLALASACVSRPPVPGHALYLGASFAGLNNPNRPTADEDNIAVAGGARIRLGDFAVRPEAHAGDHAVQFTPSVTWDFAIAGDGEGAIDGNVGVGYSAITERENNVLGNHASPFARAGLEGYLAGGVLVGAALMVAPLGYDDEDVAIAGVGYAGFRF